MESEGRGGLVTAWQNQPVNRVESPLAQLRIRARRLERRVLWRNLREYVAGALVVGAFGYYMWRFPAPIIRLGCALVIAGAVFAVLSLRTRGTAETAPAELGLCTYLDFHRKQLQRQRDLLRGVWTWYLLPFVPGIAVFLFGLLLWTLKQPNAPAHTRAILVTFALTAAGCGLVFSGVAKLNLRAARNLQREIDALDTAIGRS